jgi:hypothetical protein
MKQKILSVIIFIGIVITGKAQNLDSFSITLKPGNYLSISYKKSFTEAEAKANKSAIDLILYSEKNDGKQKLEWYNMSGKDNKTPKELTGTNTVINAISFDKEQFEKCNTTKDLQRITGHLTNNSFSHFASISDDVAKGINYHCFIIQIQNGKRALLWISDEGNNNYTAVMKIQR